MNALSTQRTQTRVFTLLACSWDHGHRSATPRTLSLLTPLCLQHYHVANFLRKNERLRWRHTSRFPLVLTRRIHWGGGGLTTVCKSLFGPRPRSTVAPFLKSNASAFSLRLVFVYFSLTCS